MLKEIQYPALWSAEPCFKILLSFLHIYIIYVHILFSSALLYTTPLVHDHLLTKRAIHSASRTKLGTLQYMKLPSEKQSKGIFLANEMIWAIMKSIWMDMSFKTLMMRLFSRLAAARDGSLNPGYVDFSWYEFIGNSVRQKEQSYII